MGRGLMVCDRLPCGLASLTCLFRFYAYGLLSFIIPLKVGNLLFSRKPYMLGY
jgi:hypothetical protein